MLCDRVLYARASKLRSLAPIVIQPREYYRRNWESATILFPIFIRSLPMCHNMRLSQSIWDTQTLVTRDQVNIDFTVSTGDVQCSYVMFSVMINGTATGRCWHYAEIVAKYRGSVFEMAVWVLKRAGWFNRLTWVLRASMSLHKSNIEQKYCINPALNISVFLITTQFFMLEYPFTCMGQLYAMCRLILK